MYHLCSNAYRSLQLFQDKEWSLSKNEQKWCRFSIFREIICRASEYHWPEDETGIEFCTVSLSTAGNDRTSFCSECFNILQTCVRRRLGKTKRCNNIQLHRTGAWKMSNSSNSKCQLRITRKEQHFKKKFPGKTYRFPQEANWVKLTPDHNHGKLPFHKWRIEDIWKFAHQRLSCGNHNGNQTTFTFRSKIKNFNRSKQFLPPNKTESSSKEPKSSRECQWTNSATRRTHERLSRKHWTCWELG